TALRTGRRRPRRLIDPSGPGSGSWAAFAQPADELEPIHVVSFDRGERPATAQRDRCAALVAGRLEVPVGSSPQGQAEFVLSEYLSGRIDAASLRGEFVAVIADARDRSVTVIRDAAG